MYQKRKRESKFHKTDTSNICYISFYYITVVSFYVRQQFYLSSLLSYRLNKCSIQNVLLLLCWHFWKWMWSIPYFDLITLININTGRLDAKYGVTPGNQKKLGLFMRKVLTMYLFSSINNNSSSSKSSDRRTRKTGQTFNNLM